MRCLGGAEAAESFCMLYVGFRRCRGGGVVLYVVCWFQAVQRLRSESLALVAGVHCASPEQLRTLCQEDVHVLHVPGNPTALTSRSHPRLCGCDCLQRAALQDGA